jgi:Zn-dependent protease
MLGNLPFLALFYPVFLFSLSCHEAAHAWTANRFGDPTARLMGRITVNPLPHMDIIGTAVLPIVAILTGAPLIGWGKPVPVNPYNLKNPRKDELWIAGFGPLSNVVLALLFAAAGRFELFLLDAAGAENVRGFAATAAGAIYTICHMGVQLNLALAVFNLIPIFPLDGGGVIRGLLPERLVHKYDMISRQSIFLLLILFATGVLKFIFIPVRILSQMLLPL